MSGRMEINPLPSPGKEGAFTFANMVSYAPTPSLCSRVRPAESDSYFPYPDDTVFFCTALSAIADDSMLVTGNKKHYQPVDFIVSPAEFCDILGI